MITRRQFLLFAAGGLSAVILGGRIDQRSNVSLASQTGPKSKVSLIKSPRICGENGLDTQKIRDMLDEGIACFTDLMGPQQAWRKFFQPDDIIALKVNPIARETGSTKPDVCYSLAEAIREGVGIPHENFVVFDVSEDELRGAGYRIGCRPGEAGRFGNKSISRDSCRGDHLCLSHHVGAFWFESKDGRPGGWQIRAFSCFGRP